MVKRANALGHVDYQRRSVVGLRIVAALVGALVAPTAFHGTTADRAPVEAVASAAPTRVALDSQRTAVVLPALQPLTLPAQPLVTPSAGRNSV